MFLLKVEQERQADASIRAEKAEAIIFDAWFQFAYHSAVDEPKWSDGGLSVLEAMNGYLSDKGMINEKGQAITASEKGGGR